MSVCVGVWHYASVNALFLIPITTNNKLVSIKFDENEKMLRIINMKNINLSSADRKRLTKLVKKL